MPHVNVTIRMDENEKKAAEKLFSKLGLTLDEAFNMFVKQVIREQAIPFKISENANVEYMDRNTINELYDKSTKKYGKAYKELLK